MQRDSQRKEEKGGESSPRPAGSAELALTAPVGPRGREGRDTESAPRTSGDRPTELVLEVTARGTIVFLFLRK